MALFDDIVSKKNTVNNEESSNQTFECEEVDVINLVNLNQSFKTDKGEFVLFDNFSLDIKDFKGQGQFISIMGQSGCGKSQLLKIISGLNKLRGIPPDERYDKAMRMLKSVGLEGHEYTWANYPILSGGQLQRVSLARNLVYSSQILLLDEATGALDIKSRRTMQDTLLDVYYNSELDPTIISVTHDILEAVYYSNRIYILTANPCKVHSIIDIDFGTEKRDKSIRDTEKFKDYVSQIEKIMNEINN